MPDKIHVSIAWPYPNGEMHMGHVAGAFLPGDIFARYHRLAGNDVLMVSGSDSHGTPITVLADAQGKSAREVFEYYHAHFLQSLTDLGISFDLFTHTDTENHHRMAQDMFLKLHEHGYLYEAEEEQFYSEAGRRFLPDRYVEGECYLCHFPDARGDQCDNCGNLLDARQLINPRSKVDGTTPVLRTTRHYYLDLAKLQPQLEAWLNEGKDFWRPNVLAFARNYVAGGLHGRAFTRDLDWGIPVPLPGNEGKCIYVWFEAVMGYLSASIEWAANRGRPDQWKDWWYAPEARIYNFIGKDNIPFHTIIWPAELMGTRRLYDDGTRPLNLPYDVPANEFMNIEGRQFSKSRNWAVYVPDYLSRYDPDPLRYYLAAAMPETRDSDFSWHEFVRRNNDELVAAWGNLANRILTFAYKHFDGRVPEPGPLTPADDAIVAEMDGAFASVGALLGACKFRAALAEILAHVDAANRYIDKQAPWFQIKSDRAAAATTVYVTLRVVDSLKTLLAPFLPFTCERLHRYLGYNEPLFGTLRVEHYTEAARGHDALVYDPSSAAGRWAPSALLAGQAMRPSQPLFKKLEPKVAEEETARLGQPAS